MRIIAAAATSELGLFLKKERRVFEKSFRAIDRTSRTGLGAFRRGFFYSKRRSPSLGWDSFQATFLLPQAILASCFPSHEVSPEALRGESLKKYRSYRGLVPQEKMHRGSQELLSSSPFILVDLRSLLLSETLIETMQPIL
jgi:hypothetical protein